MNASTILARSLTKSAASYGYGRSPFAPTGMKMDFGAKPGIRESIDMKNLQQAQQKSMQQLQQLQQERDTLKMKLEASKLQPAQNNAEPKFPATPLGSFVSGRITGLTGRLGKLKLGMPKFAYVIDIERISGMEKSADLLDSSAKYLRDAANNPGGAYQGLMKDRTDAVVNKTPWALKWAPKAMGWVGQNTMGRGLDGAAWLGRNTLKATQRAGDSIGSSIVQLGDGDNWKRLGSGARTSWNALWNTDSNAARQQFGAGAKQMADSNIAQGFGNALMGGVEGAGAIASVTPWGLGRAGAGAVAPSALGRFLPSFLTGSAAKLVGGQAMAAVNGADGGAAPASPAPAMQVAGTAPQPTSGPSGEGLSQMAMLLGGLFGGQAKQHYDPVPVGAATSSMMQSPETYTRRA